MKRNYTWVRRWVCSAAPCDNGRGRKEGRKETRSIITTCRRRRLPFLLLPSVRLSEQTVVTALRTDGREEGRRGGGGADMIDSGQSCRGCRLPEEQGRERGGSTISGGRGTCGREVRRAPQTCCERERESECEGPREGVSIFATATTGMQRTVKYMPFEASVSIDEGWKWGPPCVRRTDANVNCDCSKNRKGCLI